jgi:hypothetical protein
MTEPEFMGMGCANLTKHLRTSKTRSLIPPEPELTDACRLAGPHAVRGTKLGAVDQFFHLLGALACSSTATHGQHQARIVLQLAAEPITPPLGTQPGCLG